MKKNTLKKLLLMLLVGILAFPQVVFATGNRDWKWPVPASNSLSSCYLDGRSHYALDISATGGSSIYASYPGTVIYTYTGCGYDYGKSGSCPCGSCGGLGNSVYIKHSYNGVSYVSRYGHMRSVKVSVGQTVTKDTVIGTVGSTGYSSGNHLDFRIYKGSTTSHVAARDSMDPFKDNFLEMPSGLNANAATTACCYTYVEEVKVQYTTSEGGEHICNKGTYKYYWATHPHYNCYQCSVCGEINEFRDETRQVNTCTECRPGKPVLHVNSDNNGVATFTWSETSNTTHYNMWLNQKDEDGNWNCIKQFFEAESGFSYILEPGEYCAQLLSYSSKMWEPDESDWVHTWADDVFFTVEENVAITFNANGGTLPEAVLSDTIDGVNIGRPSGALVAFNSNVSSSETNMFGSEVAVNSQGKIEAVREYGDENQLSIPTGGFVLSGHAEWDENQQQHIGGVVFVDSIIRLYDANPESVYVALDYKTSEVKVFDSYEGYITYHKYLTDRETYGGMPIAKKEGYLFDGWFTDTSGGTEIKWDSTFSDSELYAHWVSEEDAEPSATLVDSENDKCYERYDYIMSWEEAEAFCESKGGYLVTINSLEEQELFVNIGFLENTRRGQYSIGVTDREEEGKWMWVTGEEAEFTNWDPDVPENNGGTRENYAVMVATPYSPYSPYYTAGEWIDVANTDMNGYHSSCNTGFICEYDTACNHNYQKKTTNPSCIEQGYTTYTCSNCGDSYITDYVDSLGHDYETVVTVPTCEEVGYSTHTCRKCRDSYVDSETEALGHSFTNYISDNNATDDFAGTKTAKCDRCNATDTKPETSEEIPEIPESKEVIRLAGSTRYETGYKVADVLKETLGVEQFDSVVVATGKNFADALAGSYLAVQKNAPIILTNGKDDNVAQLHEYIKANVSANGTVYILGGEVAVPKSVEEILGYTVKRLAGNSRYDTNLEILLEAGITGDEIIVATGKSFADSLSASAAKLPILLVKPNGTLDIAQKAILRNMNKIYIAGGEGAVSRDYETELSAYGTVERVFGESRYDTSVEIAREFCGNVDSMVVASGKNFPDGLCGGPLAAALNVSLILTKDNGTDAAIEYAEENTVVGGYVLGGTGALTDETVVNVFKLESDQEIK